MADSHIMDTAEEVMEELIIQRVILASMEDQSWDGIEVERDEVAQEIERLKRLHKRLKQGQTQTLVDNGS